MVSTPVIHGLLLIHQPRRDGRLSWHSWLTHSGHLTHKVVTRQPRIRRRSGKVRQLQTDVLTTEPCHEDKQVKHWPIDWLAMCKMDRVFVYRRVHRWGNKSQRLHDDVQQYKINMYSQMGGAITREWNQWIRIGCKNRKCSSKLPRSQTNNSCMYSTLKAKA